MSGVFCEEVDARFVLPCRTASGIVDWRHTT